MWAAHVPRLKHGGGTLTPVEGIVAMDAFVCYACI